MSPTYTPPALAAAVYLATTAPDWEDLAWAVASAVLAALLNWLTSRRKTP